MDKSLDVLHTDRLHLLETNKKELCQKIDIETNVLDVLIEKGVITTKDKQQVMVGYLIRPFLFSILHEMWHNFATQH